MHELLYSNNWDSRVAAAATIGLLAEAFPHHSVKDLAAAAADTGQHEQQLQQQQSQQQLEGVHIGLQAFDLAAVLEKGEPLLASGGQVRRAGWHGGGLARLQYDHGHLQLQIHLIACPSCLPDATACFNCLPACLAPAQEYDVIDTSLSLAERVAKQREQIKKRLGEHETVVAAADMSGAWWWLAQTHTQQQA